MTDQNRSFGLVMAGGLGTLATLRYVLTGDISWWLFGLGLAMLAVGLMAPAWLGPARRIWMRLAGILGVVNTRILLTVVFAGMITPIAMLLRLVGKRPIQTENHGPTASYWNARSTEEFSAKRMERQF